MAQVLQAKEAPSATIVPSTRPGETMRAAEWHGKQDVRVVARPRPHVTDPQDVVVRVTSTCICGSDLHIYLNAMPGMEKGDALGHENMGVVEEVGPEVTGIKKGDRVVSSFDLACGTCFFCKKGFFSSCDTTNSSTAQAKLYGDRTCGMHGYSHLTGGWPGGQADYVRIPFANVNALKVPPQLPDNRVVLLSDILPTAWHATELGGVGKGDVVAIWGAGPVGILAAHCAFHRGASRVILIDDVEYRLQFAREKMPNGRVETINFKEKDVYKTLREMTEHGPDVGIEAVGFHYTNSLVHKIEMGLMLETDPSEILNQMITSVRKAGRLGVVGVYAGFTNHFNIGAFMEKGMTMAAGQTPVQKYWHYLLEQIENGSLQPNFVITHELPLEMASEGYRIFNDKLENCIKVVLRPEMPAPEGVGLQQPSLTAQAKNLASQAMHGLSLHTGSEK